MERMYSGPWSAPKVPAKPEAGNESSERELTLADIERELVRLEQLSARIPEEDVAYKREIIQRVEKAKGGFLSGLGKNAAIAFLCLKVLGTFAPAVQEHLDTHDPVTAVAEASINPGEGTTYRHDDPETTEILNFFAGRGDLSSETQEKILRWKVGAAFARYGFTPPESFRSADESGMRDLLKQLYAQVQPAESEQDFIDAHTSLPERGKPHPQLYQKLWELERRVGGPQIRWSFDAPSEVTSQIAMVRGPSGAMETSLYLPNTDTIYLSPDDAFDVLVSEQSHAQQFHSAPFSYTIRYMRDAITTAARAFESKISLAESAYVTYTQDRSSLEYEAHQVIEPQLQSELPGQSFGEDSTRSHP